MASSPTSSGIICFGEFEADLRSRELWRNGAKVRLPDQAFQVLVMLLERPGELITREEIKKRLWNAETFVDFDHGLNNAVNRLREALRDSAETPRFIETLPRRGYRFLGNLSGERRPAFSAVSALGSRTNQPRFLKENQRKLWIFATLLAIAMGSSIVIKSLLGRRGQSTRIRSLAVLPLQNLSGDPIQDYFADGMTDALITNLAKIGPLRVISRTSVMAYKSAHRPLREIARELNVDAVVEGSVVRVGNRVRVNAQLIQAVPEQHLWANNYERDVTDIIALQGDMARAIANEIQIQLTPQERAHLLNTRRINSDAYNAYLMGRYFSDRGGADNLEKAVEFYEQAIRFDPNYAIAWAGLADAHQMLAVSGHARAEEETRRSRAAVERAIALDPDLAEAYASLGSIQAFVDWDWAAAEASTDKALALEPGNVSALRQAGLIAAALGRLEQSIRLHGRAVQLAPLDPRSQRGLGHMALCAGRLDEAITALDKSMQLNPEGAYIHADFAWVYLAQSHALDAMHEAEQEKNPELRLLGLVVANYALGRKKESDTALAELKQKYTDIAAFQVAQAYAFRGELDGAFKWLERAYVQRDGALLSVRYDPFLKNLHRDPRFAAFLMKMNLPIYANDVMTHDGNEAD